MTKELFYFSVVALTLSLLNIGLNPEALSLKKNYAPNTITGTPIQHEFSKVTAEEISDYLELLYEDEAYVVILDSRRKSSYEDGHIPGAYLANHYRQEKYIPDLKDILEKAPIVIVYCNGGNCEDSIFLARDLVYKHNIPSEAIHIYEGGIAEWKKLNLPIKKGAER